MSETATVADKKRDQFLSRAASRKELASTLHDLILPELSRLGGNDKVSQEAIKAIVEGVQAIVKQLEAEAQARRAFEAKPFLQRLRWIFSGAV